MTATEEKKNKKLKSLALILRSLAPESQRAIYKQLPDELVRRITQVSLDIDKELTKEDWEIFTHSWPEFSHLISGVVQETQYEHCAKFKNKERPKVQEYLDYKMGNKKGRPNLSSSITRIIDNFISQNAN
ncbi:MAG: hypothetical protein ACOYK1_00545 [Vampirovibrionia bacterium]|jgi:hypothetical protein